MASLSSVTTREYMTMTAELITFSPYTDVMAAIRTLVKHGHSGAPVVDDDGSVLGMLSEKDCLKFAVLSNHEGVSPGMVKDFMAQSVNAVLPETTLLEVASRFIDAPYKRLPVVENGKLVGQISRSDVLRAIDDLG